MRRTAIAVAIVLAASTRSAAAAQDGSRALSESDRAEARALFAAGSAAIEAGRWADAVDSFRRAWELTHAPSALFNTGFALRALGRYREALRAFDELLAIETISESMRAQATELRDEVRARIALVRLLGLEPDVTYGIRLDGEAVPDSLARPLLVQADPGRHTIDVTRAHFTPFEWTGTLGDGQTLDLMVSLVPAPVTDARSGRSVTDEDWFWPVVLGVIAVGAIAGGAVAIWYADDQAQLRPESSMPIRL